MTIGEKIKQYLETEDRTQAQLARYLSERLKKNVVPNTVNRWIPNNNPDKKICIPSVKYVLLMAEFFRVSVSEFLEGVKCEEFLRQW